MMNNSGIKQQINVTIFFDAVLATEAMNES